jgi:hypothetical protein
VTNEAEISRPPSVSFDKPAAPAAVALIRGTHGRRMRRLHALLLWLASSCACAQDVLPVPPLSGRVIDQTATLDAAQSQAWSDKLAALEQARARSSSCCSCRRRSPRTSRPMRSAWPTSGRSDGATSATAW